MGIDRSGIHKRRLTGGKQSAWRKKRKYNMARQAANTKLGGKRIHLVRCRGGNMKRRALRLDSGNFSWGSEAVARKTRILDVVYNASNNELVRTKTLVKNAVIVVDSAPFRQYFEQHYGLGLVKGGEPTEVNASGHVMAAKKALRATGAADIAQSLKEQLASGRIYACISSRPGQSGRTDGYILEGKELEFYVKKLQKKKSGKT